MVGVSICLMNRKRLALTASLTAAAVVLEASPIRFPFPLLPFLVFDFGEIPAFVLALAYGPYEATASALGLAAVLFALGQFVPIGPIYKLLAVESAILGIWAGLRFGQGFAFIVSTLIRTAVMTVANLLLVELFMPGFLQFVPDIPFMNALTALAVLLILFNILQNALSFGVAAAIVKRVGRILL